VPRLLRPDAAEIDWRVQGERGPLVVVAPMVLHPPAACAPLVAQLEGNHRVLTYDVRGTGRSSRTGPYEIETDAGDLAAVLEQAGGQALAVALGDGARRAVRAAAARPDLIHTVVVSGETPLGAASAGSDEALSHSAAVLEALLGLLETDYRTGLRTMLESSGERTWHEAALRERLDAVEGYCPSEAGVARMRSWIRDDSSDHARALGDLLWFLHFPGNAWFQGSLEGIRQALPAARFEAVPDGVISRPEENAAAIRRILAAREAGAAR
jgi:pimeloyl-ACP methyl ester carboxylesterase